MNNNQIGKNILYLYARSFLVMLISLYTSRVVLDKLGVADYGIYNTVGSVTASLSFLTGALGLAISRFITYGLGTGDKDLLATTFRSIFTLYILLSIGLVVILELFGPWFISNKLVFEPSRECAAHLVFQISIFTVVFSVLEAPFSSLVIAHEKMDFFAKVGIVEACFKLIICYLITIVTMDKLILFTLLLLIVNIGSFVMYGIYCKIHFEETVLRPTIKKDVIKSIGGFTGWSLIGQLSIMLRMQGVNIITNIFFGPVVVAARAISIQVNGALSSYISNFMTAANPQIVKRHAYGDEESSRDLVKRTTIFAFVLATIFCIPVFVNADFVLNIWLKEVPEYTVIFVRIILVQTIFDTIENGMYSVFYSQGRIKENALISPILSILMFGFVYLLFWSGSSPEVLSYCYLANVLMSCFILKPILIRYLFKFEYSFFKDIDWACLKMVLLVSPVVILHFIYFDNINWAWFIGESLFLLAYISIGAFLFVFDKNIKQQIQIGIKTNSKIIIREYCKMLKNFTAS